MTERIAFRVRRSGQRWRVEDWMPADHPAVLAGFASEGWSPLLTGGTSADDIRSTFVESWGTQDIEWSPDRMAGTFRAFSKCA